MDITASTGDLIEATAPPVSIVRGEFTFSPINHDPTFAAVASSGRYCSRMFSQTRQRWIVIEEAAGHRAEVAECVSEDLARWIADGLNAHR